MLEELDGLEVFIAAVLVGDPLAVPAAVIQIQHGSDSIHAQAVDVIFIQPVEGIGPEEIGHLVHLIIEDLGTPVRVLSLAGVRMLVQRLSVKIRKAVSISREVGRNPVQNDADALLVQIVDKIHEFLRAAVAGGGGIVAGYLVTPGSVKGMLGNAHELHVGVAHLQDIVGQLVGSFHIVIVAVLFLAHLLAPGTDVTFIDGHGGLQDVILCPRAHPLVIAPGKSGDVRGFGRGARTVFGRITVGVRLVENLAGLCGDGVFIELFRLQAGNEDFVDTAVGQQCHGRGFRIPAVEIAYQMNSRRVRRPDSEVIAGLAPVNGRVRAQLVVDFIMPAFTEQVAVQLADDSDAHGLIRFGRSGLLFSTCIHGKSSLCSH